MAGSLFRTILSSICKSWYCRWRVRIYVDNSWLPSFVSRIICGDRIFDKKRRESFQQVHGVFEKENLYIQELSLILLISLHLNISQSNCLLYGLAFIFYKFTFFGFYVEILMSIFQRGITTAQRPAREEKKSIVVSI